MAINNIVQMLDNAAKMFADTIYVANKNGKQWETYSFKNVKNISESLAAYLVENKYQKEDTFIILSEGRSNWVISELAVIISGGISVPISIKLQAEEISFRVNHSEAKAIFVSKNYFEKIASVHNEFNNKDIKLIYLDKKDNTVFETAKKYNINENNILFYDELISEGQKIFNNNPEILKNRINNTDINDTVTISYTSGTTGNPKGIMLSHKNYFSNCTQAVKTFQVPKSEFKSLLILPCDHSFAHTVGIFSALLRGISLYFVDAQGGSVNALKNIPINLKEVNSDFLLTVPALTGNFMNKIKDGIKKKPKIIQSIFNAGVKAGIKINKNGYKKADIITKIVNLPAYLTAKTLIFGKLKEIWGKDIKYFVGGGALLDISQQEFYYAIGVPVYQGYGLTEAAPIISANTPFEHKLGTSGKVFENIECKIIDENGKVLPKGKKGQIIIKGDNVMKGYFKNPEETQKTIINGWLHTGDLGYFDEDNFLVVTGREKALLISEDGEKYSPEEIEEAIVNNAELIEQVMLYNDHKKITSAVVTINKEHLKNMVSHKNINDTKEIIKEIDKDIKSFKKNKEYKNKFPEKWIPSTFIIAEEPFTEQNKMINSTMKMVRGKVLENYEQALHQLYSAKSQTPINDINIKTINNILKK